MFQRREAQTAANVFCSRYVYVLVAMCAIEMESKSDTGVEVALELESWGTARDRHSSMSFLHNHMQAKV